MSRLADRAGQYFTIVILFVSISAFCFWLPQNMGKAINAATAVLIIACPCAVALSIPVTLGNLLRIFGRNGFYLKNTNVIEAFETTNAVVFDKTGALTNGLKTDVHFVGRDLSDAKTSGRFETSPTLKPEQASVFIKINGQIRGYFQIKPTYREGFGELLDYFKKQNTKAYLLSGDNERERGFLSPFFKKTNLYFHQSPMNKLEFVKQSQENGQKVLMIGDGLNDAGALQQSDVGIVISENTNNFSPACDAILSAERFADLPKFLALAKAGSTIVGRAYFIALCYNIVGLIYAVSAQLQPVMAAILMPLSSVTIIAFGYIFYFHFSGTEHGQLVQYKEAMHDLQLVRYEAADRQANAVNENSVVALTDKAGLDAGRGIFLSKCAACHGQKGEGTVGPNMTDDYWLHGGGIKNIFKTIKYGVPDKGMISWKDQLKPSEIQAVGSYLLTLRGTNPPNPKAPQGEKYAPETVAK